MGKSEAHIERVTLMTEIAVAGRFAVLSGRNLRVEIAFMAPFDVLLASQSDCDSPPSAQIQSSPLLNLWPSCETVAKQNSNPDPNSIQQTVSSIQSTVRVLEKAASGGT